MRYNVFESFQGSYEAHKRALSKALESQNPFVSHTLDPNCRVLLFGDPDRVRDFLKQYKMDDQPYNQDSFYGVTFQFFLMKKIDKLVVPTCFKRPNVMLIIANSFEDIESAIALSKRYRCAVAQKIYFYNASEKNSPNSDAVLKLANRYNITELRGDIVQRLSEIARQEYNALTSKQPSTSFFGFRL